MKTGRKTENLILSLVVVTFFAQAIIIIYLLLPTLIPPGDFLLIVLAATTFSLTLSQRLDKKIKQVSTSRIVAIFFLIPFMILTFLFVNRSSGVEYSERYKIQEVIRHSGQGVESRIDFRIESSYLQDFSRILYFENVNDGPCADSIQFTFREGLLGYPVYLSQKVTPRPGCIFPMSK